MTDAPKIEFPCDYPIKVIGYASEDFVRNVAAIVAEQQPDFDPASIEIVDSRNGKFVSLRFQILARSASQIEALFLKFKELKNVQMVL